MSHEPDITVESKKQETPIDTKIDQNVEQQATVQDMDETEKATETSSAAGDSEQDTMAALTEAQAKAEEYWDAVLRARADLENVRRRSEIDVSNAHKFALEKFVQELLPIVDSMELGLAAAVSESAEVEKFREGSELTLKMFVAALEKFGCTQVDPLGEKFNPDLHQAITMQEKDDVAPNTVLAVVQKGYQLNERLVRPAMVIVAKSASPPKTPNIDEMA